MGHRRGWRDRREAGQLPDPRSIMLAMATPSPYAIALEVLIQSARIPADQLVTETDVREHNQHDDAAGHLPGNVRPFAA